MNRRLPSSLAALSIALTLWASPALASDYSGVQYLVYAVVLAVFIPVFAGAWVFTSKMRRRWLKILIRCVVAAAFWAPLGAGTSHVWPAACFWLYQEPIFAEAIISISVTSTILWLIFHSLSHARASA